MFKGEYMQNAQEKTGRLKCLTLVISRTLEKLVPTRFRKKEPLAETMPDIAMIFAETDMGGIRVENRRGKLVGIMASPFPGGRDIEVNLTK